MATEWIPFIDAIIKLLESIGKSQGEDDQKRKLALMAILTAANQTHGYIKATQHGAKRDFEREYALSNLWDTCSIELEHFDANLAQRCHLKGNYWRNPDEWTIEDINLARIGLDEVQKEAEYLLRLRVRPVKTRVHD
jgi:hypothetical protein